MQHACRGPDITIPPSNAEDVNVQCSTNKRSEGSGKGTEGLQSPSKVILVSPNLENG